MSEEDTPASGELVPAGEQELSGDELSPEELAGHEGQALPEREAMSSLNLNISGVENFAMPINEASALNYNSSYSVAAADADQTVILGQVAQGDSPPAEGADAASQAAAPEDAASAPETQEPEPEAQTAETTGEETAGGAETTGTTAEDSGAETTDTGTQATPTSDSSGQ